MFTEEQLNQLRGLLTPIEQRLGALEERMGGLDKRMGDLEGRSTSIEVQLKAHIEQSKKQHDGLTALILDTTEVNDKAYKKALADYDERITRIERQLNKS